MNVIMLKSHIKSFILTFFLSGSYGLPRPWYFPLQKSYWFGRSCASCTSACRCNINLKKTYDRLNFLSTMDDEHGFAMSSPTQSEWHIINLGIFSAGPFKVLCWILYNFKHKKLYLLFQTMQSQSQVYQQGATLMLLLS